jgi:putative sugar O-methyltransferase
MKEKVVEISRRAISAAHGIFPNFTARAINAQVRILSEISQSEVQAGDSIEPATVSNEHKPDNETAIIAKLVDSYTAAQFQQSFIKPAYAPGAYWKIILESEWKHYKRAISESDFDGLAKLLRNFFRNEALSGFWGDGEMYNQFSSLSKVELTERTDLMRQQYEVWRELYPTISLAELTAPEIGNPWGYSFDGHLLYEPVFEYYHHGAYIASMVQHIPTAVVLEIGGGFGGLGYQLKKLNPSVKYIALDLPENTMLQSYYLACAFPAARILTYSPGMELTKEAFDDHDIIVLPNFCVEEIPDSSCDFLVNIRSLSEMPMETIKEYMAQIDRIGRLWFFHENLFTDRIGELFGIPSTQFPELANYVGIASSKTRWPRYMEGRSYPCAENLFIHRRVLESGRGD